MHTEQKHENWSSRWVFMLAAVGSAVGLANIWRFPYTAGENGGSAFVLIYIGAVFLLALPLVLSEMLLGRRGQENPPKTMRLLVEQAKASRMWIILGFSGVISTSLILSFYSTIGGETVIYAIYSLLGKFKQQTAEQISALSAGYAGSLPLVLTGHSIFLGTTTWICARGVSSGLENAVKYLMPLLLFILILLVIFAAYSGEFIRALQYLFSPNFSRLSSNVVLEAFGQAFFSVSVGATTLMTYGSYMKRRDPIASTAAIVVTADTLVAILAGLAIFPLVFAHGLDTAGGPSLVFNIMPLSFAKIPMGFIVGTLFFLLLAFAALTSSISMLEVPVAWLKDKPQWSRSKAAVVCGGFVWLLGLLPALSLNLLADFRPLQSIGFGGTFFDLFDYLTSNILLPLVGILISLFTGWVLPKAIFLEELSEECYPIVLTLLLWLLRVFVPIVLAVVLFSLIF
jgi:NSS family neurotransmitter:Na+ symporter